MNIFEKLMLARQISFTDGRIELMGQRVLLFHSGFFSDYLRKINDDPRLTRAFYHSVKDSFRDTFSVSFGKDYGLTFKDFVKWMTDLAMTTGWGLVSWQDLDEDKKAGIVLVSDAPVGTALTGKVKKPVDHPLRGFIAGGASAAFRENVDVIEDQCVALGADQCRFVFQPAKTLVKTNKKLFLEQVGDSGKVR